MNLTHQYIQTQGKTVNNTITIIKVHLTVPMSIPREKERHLEETPFSQKFAGEATKRQNASHTQFRSGAKGPATREVNQTRTETANSGFPRRSEPEIQTAEEQKGNFIVRKKKKIFLLLSTEQ